MKKSIAAAIAGLLIVLAGWITQDGCAESSIQCHVEYFMRFTSALSEVVSSVPSPPL